MTEIHFKFKAGSISTEAQTFLCESIKRVGTRATKRHAISWMETFATQIKSYSMTDLYQLCVMWHICQNTVQQQQQFTLFRKTTSLLSYGIVLFSWKVKSGMARRKETQDKQGNGLTYAKNYQTAPGSWRVIYKGMLPCFFQGLVSCLVASTSRSLQIRLRVMWGLIMSSTNPAYRRRVI